MTSTKATMKPMQLVMFLSCKAGNRLKLQMTGIVEIPDILRCFLDGFVGESMTVNESMGSQRQR